MSDFSRTILSRFDPYDRISVCIRCFMVRIFGQYYYHLQAIVRRKLFYALSYALNVHDWQAKHALLNV